MIDTKNEINRSIILPPAFWEAFEQSIFPVSVPETIAFHIEKYAKLIEGQGYAQSIYFREYEYEVNIIAIRDAFHISIYRIPDTVRYLGVIDYNKGRKRQELCFREKLMERNPIALFLLNKIGDELIHRGLEINEKASKGALLPFEKSLKIIVCSARWLQLINIDPTLTLQERAGLIAIQVGLDPITAAGYGRYSTDKTVRHETNKAYSSFMENKYEITRKWHESCIKEPTLTPKERAETIAAEESIDPVTVAGLGRVSSDEAVKREAIKAYNVLIAAKYELTQKWRKLLDEEPHLTPQERAERIAAEQGVDPVSIAGFGRVSLDKELRHEANLTYKLLLESKHEITQRWQHLIATAPNSTPRERAEAIALELKIDPVTIAGYGSFSSDKKVKYEARKAASLLLNSKHGITKKWRDLIAREPNITPQERAKHIAIELGLDPISVSIYGRASEDTQVRAEAHNAQQRLLESKSAITVKWQELLIKEPNLTPRERAEAIAVNEGLDPITIAGMGRVSPDKEVKSEAIKAYGILLEAKHEITRQWRALIENEPHLTPKERAELIAANQGLDPITAAGYGRYSLDPEVKYEALLATNILGEDKHEITSKWRKLLDEKPNLTPKERAEHIAAEEGIDPITVAGLGRVSTDNAVRYESTKIFTFLAALKHKVTQRWRELLDKEPNIPPSERAERIAAERKVNPITIAAYGKISPDKEVRSDANKAYYFFIDHKHEVTRQWHELLHKEPTLTPKGRAEIIAAAEGIDPSSIAWFGKYSPDKEIRIQGHHAFAQIMDSKYQITQKWQILKTKRLDLTPAERSTQIAAELGVSAVTVAGYGKNSLNIEIKTEAGKAFAMLLDSKNDITQKWRKLLDEEPHLTPQERAERIAAELGLNPATVAGYGKYSIDKQVKTDVHKARYALSGLKLNRKKK